MSAPVCFVGPRTPHAFVDPAHLLPLDALDRLSRALAAGNTSGVIPFQSGTVLWARTHRGPGDYRVSGASHPAMHTDTGLLAAVPVYQPFPDHLCIIQPMTSSVLAVVDGRWSLSGICLCDTMDDYIDDTSTNIDC